MRKWLAVVVLMTILGTPAAWAEVTTAPGAADTISSTAAVVNFAREEAVTVAGGGEAWYKLYVEGSGMLKLTLTGAQATQVQMDVYNEQAELLGRASAADGALGVEVDASRDYWFFIRLKGQEVDGTASLQLKSELAAPAPEHTVPADAAALPFNEPTNGHVVAGSDRWFTLEVPAGAEGDYLVVDMEGKVAEIDIDLTMTDLDGRALNSSESSRPHERVFAQIPENRKVALRVFIYRGSDNTAAAENDFTLRAYTTAEPPSGTFAPNLPQEFTAVELGTAVDGTLRDEAKWYRYHIEERGNLRVAVTGNFVQVEMFVEDGSRVFDGAVTTGNPLRITGDANKYTDFYIKVSGTGDYVFTGTLETGEFVTLPTTVTNMRARHDVRGTMREEVWFRFIAPKTGYALFAFDAQPGDTATDIDLMVTNSEGKVIGKADSTKPREALLLDVEKDQTYYVRVYPYRTLDQPAEFVLWVQTLDRKL